MRVIIFGATGMVGQGVLRECLQDPGVELTVTIGRSVVQTTRDHLHQILHPNMEDLSSNEHLLTGLDACFFTLGVSSAGMSEAAYERITYGLTLHAAQTLSRLNPGMTFIYVSGQGTDSSEKGSSMWARIKGRTENALLALPLKAYMLRPGIIQPLDGIKSRTLAYRIGYAVARPVLPLLRAALPNQILTTREIGQAMLKLARQGYPKPILETKDIRALLNQQ
jgi:uncharacterized protein YbjT (DUF2867 family)